MLGNQDAVANIAVRNLEIATDFYERRLGLTPLHAVGGELIALPTYTAMLALRDILARRGYVRQYWEAA